MNLRRPLRSSVKAWLAISIPLFLGCWFIRDGKYGDEPMWDIWRVIIAHDYICPTSEMLTRLGICTVAFAVPAAVVGWILQFPICAALDYFHRRKDE